MRAIRTVASGSVIFSPGIAPKVLGYLTKETWLEDRLWESCKCHAAQTIDTDFVRGLNTPSLGRPSARS